MDCFARISSSKTGNELRKLIGDNDVLFTTMLLEASDVNGFTEDFQKVYKESNKGAIAPLLDPKTKPQATKIAKAIYDYYYKKHPNIDSTVRNQDSDNNTTLFGYSSIFNREKGKAHVATFILDTFNNLQNSGAELKKNKLEYYRKQAKKAWLDMIFDSISKRDNKKVDNLKKEYKNAEDKASYINKLLGGNEKNITYSNYYAVYQELFASDKTSLNYINEVFTNPNLADVYHQIKGDLDEENAKLGLQSNEELDGVNPEGSEVNDVELDTSITTLNNHIGAYTSFMTHVGPRIRNYFNTLRKLASPTIGDFDTSNDYGIAETMNANACSSMLYNQATFHNVDDMIKSIQHIGQTVSGFEAFVKLAKDLEDNPDFATEMFTVFAKTKIDKLETVVKDGIPITRISNTSATPRNVLVFDLRNDIKGVIRDNNAFVIASDIKVLDDNIDEALKNIKKLSDKNYSEKDKINFKNKADNALGKAKQEIIRLIKTYYPSVQDAAILSYIEMNNNAAGNTKIQLENIQALSKDINDACKATDRSYNALQQMTIRAAKIKENNDNLDKARKRGEIIDFNEYQNEKSVYSDDFIEPQDASIQKIVNKLLPYSIVNTQLNSRNIHGNNTSNIINNSLITQIDKMLKDNYEEKVYDANGKFLYTRIRNKTLEAWGLEKLRSKQYKYSNILLEQTDENGKVLNRGIFKYVNGQLVISENAENLIKLRLFDGAGNMDNNTNLSYSEMTSGDYLPTDFINFFNTKTNEINDVANYFLRTPSDAPKTFTIRAPKYNTHDLFTVEDKESFNDTINDIVKTHANVLTAEDYNNKYRPDSKNFYFSKLQTYNIENYLTPTENTTIPITDVRSIKKIEGTEQEDGSYEAYVTYGDDKTGDIVVVKGTIEKTKSQKGYHLINVSYEGTFNNTKNYENGIPTNVSGYLTKYYRTELLKHDVTINDKTWTKAEQIVNVNHPVYKMIKNQFKQEMLDAAVALSHYFNFRQDEDGYYSIELKKLPNDEISKEPKFKEGMSNTKGYKFYHLGSNGTVLEKNGEGFKLAGNVFHSNKFTLAVENADGTISKKNYLDEIISNDLDKRYDGSINLLYGGAMRIVATLGEDGNYNVEDVIFSDLQQEKIDKALSDFLTEYQKQAINKIDSYKNFIQGVDVTNENITSFAINNLLMHYNYDELFEGNTKFYKDSQTILKRAKEYQGSGVPYGIANYNIFNNEDLSDVKEHSFLNNGTIEETSKDSEGKEVVNKVSIQDLFKGTLFEGTTQRYGFRGVTIKNTQRTNVTALEELVKKLVKDSKIDEEVAREILFGPIVIKNGEIVRDKEGNPVRKGGFTETKVNDAQSYITVQEWVRRISARGQLQRYLPLIKKIIEADKNPDIKLDAKTIKEFVQVQKNFYYDMHYDKNYGIYVPRQIKNAEFVLIPSLIKGTQLEHVYNMMREGNIDQLNTVETSKAANEEVLTIWDNDAKIKGLDGVVDEDEIAKATNKYARQLKENAQIYSYNNLYTQQETPQHMNAENKAGIQIMKKLIDNLPDDDSDLGKLKKEYFKLFTRNIEESFTDLLDNFEIPYDENGNIELDDLNHIKNINLKVFYNKLKEELMRTGIDSNLNDYVTIPEGSSIPSMPAALMNNVLTKFESVVQSLFNNNITRQKLPGFHAAQITNVGWSPLNETIEDVSYNKTLKYHPGGEPYIEVMLPASFLGINKNDEHYKNMTNKEIIAELEAKGLDMIIGYRIPTEGKQSVCNMKVVGITDDAFGSTIVVPDDWVSQTGSDFDIDSVYGIQFETYKIKSGEVFPVEYKEAKNRNKYDWFNYVTRFTEDKDLDPNVKSKIADAKKEINSELQAELVALEKEETEIWNKFNENEKNIIKGIQDKITKAIRNQGLEGKEAYDFRLTKLIGFLNNTKRKAKNKNTNFIKTIDEIVPVLESIDAFIMTQGARYNEGSKQRIDNILNERLDKFNNAAKNAGLLTLDEYLKFENDLKANTRKARNNKLLSIMKEILSDPKTLEENLSRSNFDDLVRARNAVMNPNVKAARDGRSPYNVFDQIDYQEDAMSGAKLKAFSVTLDTFCSVCNKVRPTLEKPVYIVYNTNDYKNPQAILDRFNAGKLKDKAKTFAIKHSTYGWSKDNRNVAGKILTAYSSQTTAFILDAIKEGAIPNVNDYTFSVFKTLANIGTDYNTSVAFIMQPGIEEIVKANNSNKSVYSTTSGNPIHQAIRTIAKQLGISAEDNVPITAVLASINKAYNKEFNKIFKQQGDDAITISLKEEDTKNLPIIASMLVDRLKNTGKFSKSSPVEKSLFDLGVILSFNKLHDIANTIGDIARCCNPDKFGAKQTVFETRQVFTSIDQTMFNQEVSPDTGIIVRQLREPVLSVNGKHILASIYPGSDDINSDSNGIINNLLRTNKIAESSYPSLYAFLKYASATSTVVAKTIFDTQDDGFVKLITDFKDVLNGYNQTINEDTYNDLQKYVLSSLYKQVPAIRYLVNVRTNDKGEIEITQNIPTETDKIEEASKAEITRIYGYERDNSISIINKETYKDDNGKTKTKTIITNFEVKDINNPTKDEMKLYEQLSPAQKVQFIKSNFSNAGIFSLLNVSLFNSAARGKWVGMQTLEYKEQNINPNVVYAEFRKAFYNNNPLIVSAAIDLVKYAAQVEGMRMTATAINKIIDNKCLVQPFGRNGLGFVDSIKQTMNDIKNGKGHFGYNLDENNDVNSEVETLYENYLRSHPETKGIKTVYLSKRTQSKYGLYKHDFGTYYLKVNDNKDSPEDNLKAFNQRLTNIGIKTYLPLSDKYKTNKYIRFRDSKSNNLYRIVEGDGYIVLYPLSKLEANENSEWSANEDNNRGILSKRAYTILTNDFAKVKDSQEFTHNFIKERMEHYKETGEKKTFFYKERKNYNRNVPAADFSIEKEAKDGGSMAILRQQIINHFKNPLAGRLFVKNGTLTNYIFSPGVENGSEQTIHFGNNDTRRFILSIPDNLNKVEKQCLKGDKDGNKVSVDNIQTPSLRTIVKNAQDAGLTRLSGVVEVIPVVENEAYAASLEELDSNSIDFAHSRRAAKNDQASIDYLEKLRSNDINASIESIGKTDESRKLTTRETAKYARHTADYIRTKLFNQFIEDPDNADAFISITDDRIIAMIKKDPKLMNKYMEAVNIAQAFINEYTPYREFDATSEDSEIRMYINDIKQALDDVSKLPLSDVLQRGAQATLDKYSTNPLVKEGLIDVMDGYWKTYGVAWQFNDIMENGTPILQVMLKNVMDDIDARDKAFQYKTKKEFWNKIREIQAEARRKGETIDWNHIVDEDGRFIQDYDNKFIDDMQELRNKMNEEARLNGYGSLPHLKAKLEYDQFKANHCNQPAAGMYYQRKCALERAIIYGYDVKGDPNLPFESTDRHVPGFPDIYSKYMKLFYKRLDIFHYMSNDGLNENQRQELNKISQEMFNLVRPGIYADESGRLRERPYVDEGMAVTDSDTLKFYSRESQRALKTFLDNIAQLNDEYFAYDSAYGFEDQLKINLNIIASYEDRDANGIPQKPQDWLDAQPEYYEAKQWVQNNARFVLNTANDENGEANSIGAKLKEAFRWLGLTSSGKNRSAADVMRNHNNGEGIYDENHVLDGRKLSDEELAEVKDKQLYDYKTKDCPPFTDRVLISNAKPDNTVFTSDFYEGMSKSRGNNANQAYLACVTELNKLLEPYYNNIDGNIHFEQIPDTNEGIELLKKIAQKYQEIRAYKETDNTDRSVSDFIKDNVEFVTNEVAWNGQIAAIKSGNFSDDFKNAFILLAYERKTNGDFVQRNGNFVPNRFLYSYAKPQGKPGDPSYERFVDHKRNEALNLINQVYRKVPTKYYYQSMHEAMAKAQKNGNYNYMDWYIANHIYNPYTRKMQPLDCWLTSEVRDELFKDNTFEGKWVPRSNQRDKVVRDGTFSTVVAGQKISAYDKDHDMRNHDYNPDLGLIGNYVKGSQKGKYDSKIVMNDSEKAMRDYLQKVLMQTANVESARRYFERGYLPASLKPKDTDLKMLGKEGLKLVGIGISSENGKKDWYNEIGYEFDKTPLMPMTKLLESKQTIDLQKKIKQINERTITREQFNTDEEFNKAVTERDEKIAALETQLKKERNALLNRDWLNVIDCYLEQANRYNAINDNKTKLYFLHNVLKNMQMYSRKYGLTGDLDKNTRKSSEGNIYSKSVDENLIKQYENTLRRLLFDQWKAKEGNITKYANTLQGFVSANYMMLNVRGGISNVTLGETGILAEAFAGEFFSKGDWAFGTKEWTKGSLGFARGGFEAMFNHEGTSYNKQDAIIKFFNVVDYDEIAGVVHELNLEEYSKKLRDAMFSPQTIGEHFMQNSVLFGMLHGHKIVTMLDGSVMAMNKRQYIDYRQSQILDSILSEDQLKAYNEFKENIKKDPNKLKDYAWFRRDALTDWVYLHTSKEQSDKFFAERNKKEKEFAKEFDDKINMYDQIELGNDGKLAFKEGSELAELDKKPHNGSSEISEAMALVGAFSNKVRKVNNRIHGAYNRQSAAYIERTWWGSLVMQYHKHLPIGILKRYMARGHYNETRGSVDKGMVQTIKDLFRLNWDKIKVDAGLTDEQAEAGKSFTFILAHSFDYLTQLKQTLKVIPPYEKANLIRNLGDLTAVLGGMAMVAALWYIADDDNEIQDTIWFNMWLYEADRLTSEGFLYNPLGLANETKKIMSTPIAAQSIITDGLNTIKGIVEWMFDDEYDPYYHSGRFAGERKISVYIQRRIPIWNGIRGVLDSPINNHYYKVGYTPLGAGNVKKFVTDNDD